MENKTPTEKKKDGEFDIPTRVRRILFVGFLFGLDVGIIIGFIIGVIKW